MKTNRFTTALLATASVLASTALPAYAQEAPKKPTEGAEAAGDIVVTARRRD